MNLLPPSPWASPPSPTRSSSLTPELTPEARQRFLTGGPVSSSSSSSTPPSPSPPLSLPPQPPALSSMRSTSTASTTSSKHSRRDRGRSRCDSVSTDARLSIHSTSGTVYESVVVVGHIYGSDNVVYYLLEVRSWENPLEGYVVRRRYNDFKRLHHQLAACMPQTGAVRRGPPGSGRPGPNGPRSGGAGPHGSTHTHIQRHMDPDRDCAASTVSSANGSSYSNGYTPNGNGQGNGYGYGYSNGIAARTTRANVSGNDNGNGNGSVAGRARGLGSLAYSSLLCNPLSNRFSPETSPLWSPTRTSRSSMRSSQHRSPHPELRLHGVGESMSSSSSVPSGFTPPLPFQPQPDSPAGMAAVSSSPPPSYRPPPLSRSQSQQHPSLTTRPPREAPRLSAPTVVAHPAHAPWDYYSNPVELPFHAVCFDRSDRPLLPPLPSGGVASFFSSREMLIRYRIDKFNKIIAAVLSDTSPAVSYILMQFIQDNPSTQRTYVSLSEYAALDVPWSVERVARRRAMSVGKKSQPSVAAS